MFKLYESPKNYMLVETAKSDRWSHFGTGGFLI